MRCSPAGELIWRAGPLARGSACATAPPATACAFLALHARTGDARWLDRARRFAMHALAQVERARAAPGRGRYSLWTGDLGAAGRGGGAASPGEPGCRSLGLDRLTPSVLPRDPRQGDCSC